MLDYFLNYATPGFSPGEQTAAVYNHGWVIGDSVGDLRPRAIRAGHAAAGGPGVLAMSSAEHPDRIAPEHETTVEDVRQLMGASTPHFALQLRERIRRLIKGLPEGHPARVEGEREIARLDRIAFVGEVRGHQAEDGLTPMRSLGAGPAGRRLSSGHTSAAGRETTTVGIR